MPASAKPAAASSAASTAAEQPTGALKQLLGSLKKNAEELPPEVQTALQMMQAQEGQQTVKNAHKALASVNQARKENEAAIIARAQLHTEWKKFLSDSVEKWQAYSQRFMESETMLAEKVNATKEALRQARLRSKEAVEKLDEGEDKDRMDAVEVSDGEEETKPDLAEKIQEGLTGVCSTLENLKKTADSIHIEQPPGKRQRSSEHADGQSLR